MKLPPEIRLMIYELAVQDDIAAAMGYALLAGCWELDRQPYLGALALVHTSTIVRKESRSVMHDIAHRQWQDFCGRSKFPEGKTTSDSGLRHLSRCWKALEQSYWVGDMWRAKAEPRSTKPWRS